MYGKFAYIWLKLMVYFLSSEVVAVLQKARLVFEMHSANTLKLSHDHAPWIVHTGHIYDGVGCIF